MQALELSAIINQDGQIVLDAPLVMRNKKVKVIILVEDSELQEREEWLSLSAKQMAKAYAVNEPDYNAGALQERNPNYKDK